MRFVHRCPLAFLPFLTLARFFSFLDYGSAIRVEQSQSPEPFIKLYSQLQQRTLRTVGEKWNPTASAMTR
jgi:hypothetical protein